MLIRCARVAAGFLAVATLAACILHADEQPSKPPRPSPTNEIHIAPVSPAGERPRGAEDVYLAFHLEFNTAADRERFKMPDVTIVHGRDRWADVLVSVRSDGQLNQVAEALWSAGNDPNDPYGLAWAEPAERIAVPPPRKDFDRLRAKPQIPIVAGGIDGLAGRGVIIVIVDTGIDFRHPDFINFDASGAPTSRLLHLWDTTEAPTSGSAGKPAHLTYPNGVAIGTIYSREDLTGDLRKQLGGPQVRARDMDGHGTACAGIAAGNGNRSNGELPGVAPAADLIGVRIAVGDPFLNGYLLGAICEWVESVSQGRPYVISCSFGGRTGSCDGLRIDERQLAAYFPPDAAGRALCFAGGNDADFPVHASIKIAPGGEQILPWGPGEKEGYLKLFLTCADSNAFQLAPGTGIQPDGYHRNPFSGHWFSGFLLPPGPSQMTIRNVSQVELTGDAYVSFGDGPARGFLPEVATAARQIGSPGSALAAITVASYDWFGDLDHANRRLEVGAISTYSSRGPLRTGDTVKPDITAPGQWFAAPGSGDVQYDWRGQYRWMNGTSAATPYVAGIVALMLEKNPKLTCEQIRSLLHKHATQDSFTGDLPNAAWGYGKLDVAAVKRILAAIQ